MNEMVLKLEDQHAIIAEKNLNVQYISTVKGEEQNQLQLLAHAFKENACSEQLRLADGINYSEAFIRIRKI